MRLLATIVLAGCWSSSPSPPTTPQPVIETGGGTWRPARVVDRCATVVKHVYEYVRADPSAGQFPGGMLDELEDATLDHCHSTAWSTEALDCYEKASAVRDTSACFQLMTIQQRDSWQEMFTKTYQRYQSYGGGPTP